MSALLHPYKYSIEEGRYCFETESGIKYFAYFLDMSVYAPSLYTFSFEKLEDSDQKKKPGLFVLDTICQILQSFFEQHSNAVLFVCDSTDGRAEGRMRLFSKAFNQVNDGNYVKVDRQGHTSFYSVYSSLFFHIDNPDAETIISAFEEMCDDSLIE